MNLEWIDENDAAQVFRRTRLECDGRLVGAITRTAQSRIVQAPVRWFVESTSGMLRCNGEAASLDIVPMLQAMIVQMVTTEHQYSHVDADDSDTPNEQEHAHQ